MSKDMYGLIFILVFERKVRVYKEIRLFKKFLKIIEGLESQILSR